MMIPRPLDDTLALIGNTPLVRLAGPSEAAGCDIWGKCEFANPGGSVKDRAALFMIRDAEERGELQPGGTVIEGTAGNTGIGIALVANALGYRTVIVMPDNQSREKMDTLRALGARLKLVPPTRFSDPCHFQHVSRRMAEETEGAIWAGQFDNTANRRAHIEGTAIELWEQTGGRIDGFTCAAGTGRHDRGRRHGTEGEERRSVHRADRSARRSALQLLCPRRVEGRRLLGRGGDRAGSHHRQPRRRADRYPVPGVGRGRARMGRAIAARRGAVPGVSSGINVAGAVALGRRLVEEGRATPQVATILCDTGFRYLSTLYDPDWLRERELPVFDWLQGD